jgi:ribose transport system substrate-binding protein
MESDFTIAVVAQGSLHQYWKALRAGALAAKEVLKAQGISIDVAWRCPIREDDREEQVRIVEGFARKRVHGLVLAPFDDHSLVGPVEEAANLGIPTVVVDSPLDTPEIVSFVATENRDAGALAANRIGELLHRRGKVLLLRYQEGSASTKEREEGFAWRLRRTSPNIELLVSDRYAGTTRDTARTASEALLARHGKDLQGVFTPNESSTAGMLMALQAAKVSDVAMVGFDASDVYLHCLTTQRLQGLVVQNPFRMGELGVKAIVDHLQGKSVSNRIRTDAVMITPENMDNPEFRKMLHPIP